MTSSRAVRASGWVGSSSSRGVGIGDDDQGHLPAPERLARLVEGHGRRAEPIARGEGGDHRGALRPLGDRDEEPGPRPGSGRRARGRRT